MKKNENRIRFHVCKIRSHYELSWMCNIMAERGRTTHCCIGLWLAPVVSAWETDRESKGWRKKGECMGNRQRENRGRREREECGGRKKAITKDREWMRGGETEIPFSSSGHTQPTSFSPLSYLPYFFQFSQFLPFLLPSLPLCSPFPLYSLFPPLLSSWSSSRSRRNSRNKVALIGTLLTSTPNPQCTCLPATKILCNLK